MYLPQIAPSSNASDSTFRRPPFGQMNCPALWLPTLLICMAQASLAQQEIDLRNRTNATRDIPYADTDDPAQRLDLYLPKNRIDSEELPVLVFIHGGAWRGGNKRAGAGRLAKYVASGRCAGVSVEYRLTDKATWPAQIHDCKAAVRWIRGNAGKYQLNPQRIVVWGTSAGGHLVSMLGTSSGVTELEGALGNHLKQSSRVTAVIDFFGPADLLTMNEGGSTMDHYAANSPESILVGGPVKQRVDAANSASPVHHVSPGDAPFLIMHGTKDPLVPHRQSERLHAALKQQGVSSTFISVEGGGHGFAGKSVDVAIERFLDLHFDGRGSGPKSGKIAAQPKKGS